MSWIFFLSSIFFSCLSIDTKLTQYLVFSLSKPFVAEGGGMHVTLGHLLIKSQGELERRDGLVEVNGELLTQYILLRVRLNHSVGKKSKS